MQTVILVKPDAVVRGIESAILSDLKEIVGEEVMSRSYPTDPALLTPMFERHYAEHQGKDFYPNLIATMSKGPVLAWLFEGDNVVARVRSALPGLRVKHRAPDASPSENSIHASDSEESAAREKAIWFD